MSSFTQTPTPTSSLVDLAEALGPLLGEAAAERDATDAFVGALYPELKARGLFRMLVPDELGGLGASHREACEALRRLARFDGSTALTLSMHTHAVGTLAYQARRGHDGARATLRRIAQEGLVLATTGGRDWLESSGTVTAVEGGYRVSAKKPFASGISAADVVVTSAPDLRPGTGWQVLHFSLPMRTPGISVRDDWEAHGMRATGSHTVVFDEVFVPEAAIAVVRSRDAFPSLWSVVLGVALPLIYTVYLGVAEAAVERARPLAGRRAEAPTTQWSVGEMDSALVVGRTLHAEMVALADDLAFEPSIPLASELLALESGLMDAVEEAVNASMDAAGGAGFMRGVGLERLVRDARAGRYHPLPKKAQRELTGRVGLDLDPVDLGRWSRTEDA